MKQVWKAGLAMLAIALGACSDSSTAPQAAATNPPDASAVGGGSNASLTGSDTVRFSFTIDPSRTITYPLGAGNTIVFPAHSLCDPNRSTYGATEWDKPCTLATKPLVETAKAWLDHDGHPQIDFGQDIRFVPSANPANWVVISFTDAWAAKNPALNIMYCGTGTKQCIDESTTDPSLLTVHDPVTGRLTRRIKHFSGYNVAAGDAGFNASMSVRPTAPAAGSASNGSPKPVSGTASAVFGTGTTSFVASIDRSIVAPLGGTQLPEESNVHVRLTGGMQTLYIAAAQTDSTGHAGSAHGLQAGEVKDLVGQPATYVRQCSGYMLALG